MAHEVKPAMILHTRPVTVLVLHQARKNDNVRIPSLGVRQPPSLSKAGVHIEKVRERLGSIIEDRHRHKIRTGGIVKNILENLHPPLVRHIPAFQVIGKPVGRWRAFAIERHFVWRIKYIAVQQDEPEYVLPHIPSRIQGGKGGTVAESPDKNLLRTTDFPHKV